MAHDSWEEDFEAANGSAFSGIVHRQYHNAMMEKKDAEITKLKAEREELLSAVKHYADELNYFPRNIVLECQKRGVRLAPIYSDFGECARAALERIKEVQDG